MNTRIKPTTATKGQTQTAIAQLIDRDSDFDTSTVAWIAFDAQMTAQFADLEAQFRRYWTPQAVRESLGR